MTLDPPTITPEAPLDRDVPCQRCGYNLRGLPRSGRCPECGMPVEMSLNGDMLRYADPQWLSALVRGARMARISIYGLIASIPLLLVGWWPMSMFTSEPELALLAVFVLLLFITVLALLMAVIVFAAPNAAELPIESRFSARKVCRCCAVLAALIICGYLISLNYPALQIPLAGIAAAAVLALSAIAGTIAYWRYLRRISRRLGRSRLVHDADSTFCGFILSLLTLILSVMLSLFANERRFADCASLPAIIGVAVFGLLFLAATGAVVHELQHAQRHAAGASCATTQRENGQGR